MAYAAYVTGRDAAASGGNVTVMTKFAIHCAAAATPSAFARIEFGKISPSSTHTSGPHDAPKHTTKRLAATRAIGPHAPSSSGPLAPATAWLKASAMVPSETAMPIEPAMRMGRRPMRSTSAIAMRVTRMLTMPVPTEIASEFDSVNPTAFHRVVE